MQSVAVIRQLGRYPVKSMRGESLAATTLTLQGVPADRRYAFVQTASRSSFPWLTARELEKAWAKYRKQHWLEIAGRVPSRVPESCPH